MPPKEGKKFSASPKTLEAKEHLIKLLKEIDVELLEYSQVVKAESTTTRTKTKKENVTVPVKLFDKSGYNINWESKSIEFEKGEKGSVGKMIDKIFDKSKTILLSLESIGNLKRKMDKKLELFSFQDIIKEEQFLIL